MWLTASPARPRRGNPTDATRAGAIHAGAGVVPVGASAIRAGASVVRVGASVVRAGASADRATGVGRHPGRLRLRWVATIALTIAIGGQTAGAHAQIYKCAGHGNIPLYQGTPCPPGQELRNFALDPAEVSVLPLPPSPSTGSAASAAARSNGSASRPRATPRAERSRGGDPAQRRYLFAGMQAGEVLARAGAPDMKAGGHRSSRWTYLPHPGDPQTLTTVVIEDGRVVNVERKVVR